jgi:YD repeat-containing protein
VIKFYASFALCVRYFLLLTTVIASRYCFAQSDLDVGRLYNVALQHSNSIQVPSPAVASFAKYVDNPVGHYSGIPNISIPLHNVQLRDFNLPISLSYYAGGIKVEEDASHVGLGWNLNAGGAITRAIKDKPDDSSISFCDENWIYPSGVIYPNIAGHTKCGNGWLWAANTPSNANFDGFTNYNININSYPGINGTANASIKLIKKFFGVAYNNFDDMYLMSMIDKEPDIFYFNFGNRTGQFVFDVSTGTATARMFPHQDLQITFTTDARKKINSFQIIDEQGIKYTFAAIEKTENVFNASMARLDDLYVESMGLDHQVRVFETGSGLREYNSSWYLSRIDTPLGDYLNITYADEQYSFSRRGPQQSGLFWVFRDQQHAGHEHYNPNDTTDYGYYNNYLVNYSTIKGKRISLIENDNVKIEFSGVNMRQDLPATYFAGVYRGSFPIEQMGVFTKIGGEKRIKKFALTFDYFLSDENEYMNPVLTKNKLSDFYQEIGPDIPSYFKRLRLRSVQEFGDTDMAFKPPHTFYYKDFDFTGDPSDRLPHKLSYKQDCWGFFNGALNNLTLIPRLYVYPTHYPIKDSRQFRIFKRSSFVGPEIILDGAYRLPNAEKAKIGILTKIIYPTKGYTQYTYEPHVFREKGDNEDITGGGLRIKAISKSDDPSGSNTMRYDYEYANGEIITMPIFAMRQHNFDMLPNDDSKASYNVFTIRYSLPQMALGKTNGSYVGYRTVTEYMWKDHIIANGKTVFTFSLPASWHVANDIPTSGGGICNPTLEPYCDAYYSLTVPINLFVGSTSADVSASNYDFAQNPATGNTFPFPDNPNYEWQRGHRLSETYYNQNNRKVKEIMYTYKNYFPESKNEPTPIFGFKISPFFPTKKTRVFADAYIFRVAKYKIVTDVAKVVASQTETQYQDGVAVISTVSNFTYANTNHVRVTAKTSTASNGDIITENFQYAEDVSGTELGGDLLRAKHMDGILLRESVKRGTTTISKKETTYQDENGKALAGWRTIYADGTNETQVSKFEYDGAGNLASSTEVVAHDDTFTTWTPGSRTSYIWDYNLTSPIAKIENGDLLHSAYSSFEADGKGFWNYSGVSSTPPTSFVPSGVKCLNLSAVTITRNNLSSDKTYNLSYWSYGGTVAVDGGTQQSKSVNGPGGWKLNLVTITGATSVGLTGSGYIDELRLHEAGARMTTYSYSPEIGITSVTDANNVTTYYEYDGLGRLKLVLDRDKNILKQHTYNYRQ